eukprot:TRINITY_DN14042_c0_g1_i1.p1 TRINITY_DN14042_c0_g1~~TRINITY_DN14042_c0_g1_i1.p1  ORF type:complete len:322 (-),score=52.55 TRINITY_DN14042_c0_g1_i1:421-1386(-)
MSAQLHHPGLFCMSSKGTPMGPSMGWLPSKLAVPQVMSLEQCAEVRREFVRAAELAIRAGFDCLELHCGHGYLLSQYLSPILNRRSDKYGGDVSRRAEFPLSVLRAIRSMVGPSFPLVVKMNADDGFTGGLRLPEALETARLFAVGGADAIVPSCGFTSLNGFGMLRGNVPMAKMVAGLDHASSQAPPGTRWILKVLGQQIVPKLEYDSLFLRESAVKFVAALDGYGARVIYVGGADSLAGIQQTLSDGCLGVQLGRPLIREPFFVRRLKRAADASAEAESKCIRCNLCVLASMNPVLFKPGCPFLKPGEGADFEDLFAHL